MSKFSDVVKSDVAKKTEYDKLVGQVNNIDTSDFVLKTKYNTDKTQLVNKIPDTSDLLKTKIIITLKLQNQKIKFLKLVASLKKLIIILKLQN